MADTGQELIQAALAAVEDRIQQQIEAARQRRERDRQRRAEFAAARRAGLGYRNAQKLRNLRSPEGHADPGANAVVAQKATVAADNLSAANDRGTAPAPDLLSRYTPRAREDAIKEVPDGRE